MNIKFKSLKLKNFLSFGNKVEEYTFPDGEIVNVKGQNLDIDIGVDNGSSNGSGKSSVMQGIIYALYGRGVNDIKQDEFINITNGKDMRVELTFTADGKEIEIVRTRKPNAVQILVDGEDETRDSIANTNDLIQSYIRVNYETFVLSFLMTTAVDPLMRRKPSEQRNFMEELLGMNALSQRADGVKRIRDELAVDIKLLDKDIEYAEVMNQKEIDLHEQNARKFKAFEEKRNSELERLDAELTEADKVLDREDEIRESFADLESAQDAYDKATSEKVDIERDIAALRKTVYDLERKIRDGSGNIEIIQSKLRDAEASLVSLQMKSDKMGDGKDLEAELEKVETFVALIEREESIQNELDALNKTLNDSLKDQKKIEEQLDHLTSGTCPYCSQAWTNDDQKAKVAALEDQIGEIEKEVNATRAKAGDVIGDLHTVGEEIVKLGMDQDEADAIVESYETFQSKREEISRRMEEKRREVEDLQIQLETAQKALGEIEQHKADKESAEGKIVALESSLEEAEANVRHATSTLGMVEDRIKQIPFKSELEFERFLNEASNKVDEYERIRDAENPHPNPEKNTPKLIDVSEVQEKKKAAEVEIAHCKYLIKLLTDSKSFIRRNIIGRYIPYLNKMINTYAEKLDSPHVCEIQNDLTVSIEYMRKPVSYHSLSAGERLKLDVSVSIALRDLMAMIGVKSDFLMVDELFDSALDTQSKRNVFRLIKDRFNTVMLVSHSGEFDDKCDSTLTVTKENGFSRLSLA